MSDCTICEDSKHTWCEERQAYVACECLKAKNKAERYVRAGIPSRYDAETWKTFATTYDVEGLRRLVSVVRTVKEGNVKSDWILVHGRPVRARMLAAALMLRSACDGGLESRQVDIPTLIDAEFQPGRGQEFYRLPALIVEVGQESQNKWNRIVLEKVVHQRWEASRFTMLIVDGEPGRVASNYKSTRIINAMANRFKRVRVGPKENE